MYTPMFNKIVRTSIRIVIIHVTVRTTIFYTMEVRKSTCSTSVVLIVLGY